MKTEKRNQLCLEGVFHQASEEVKLWPKWMQQPEVRNTCATVKSKNPCPVCGNKEWLPHVSTACVALHCGRFTFTRGPIIDISCSLLSHIRHDSVSDHFDECTKCGIAIS